MPERRPRWTRRFSFLRAVLILASVPLPGGSAARAESVESTFRAGAAAVDITPERFPVVVSGGFLAGQAASARDRLHSRALVLDDGATRLALVVVDSLMIGREMLDRVKARASRLTGIPPARMLISATHTHSAPSVLGALGTPVDEAYAEFLPGRIVESLVAANSRLEPAEIGWTAVDAPEHNHCRRWIRRPDRIGTDPFGDVTVRAMMHPGHRSPDHTGPSGPADTLLSLLAVRSAAGRPIAVLAHYAMHYKGSTPVSADVCGRFGGALADCMGAGQLDPPFVGMLAQGTSGDSMWMDYSRPRRDPGLDGYTQELARMAYGACKAIEYRAWVSLAMAESLVSLDRRIPGPRRLAWARAVSDGMGDRLPRNRTEVYALEALHLAARPRVELKVQALRIGELGIAALPNEVYGLTGLKIRARSPLPATFTIELANGAEGYIPPPEQHDLGGYTTWPARTAGLEIGAEPRLVHEVLTLLEGVSGRERSERREPLDAYLRAVLASRPDGLWLLDEMEGPGAADSSAAQSNRERLDGAYEPGVAFWLAGRGAADSHAGSDRRAVHLAGGCLRIPMGDLADAFTVELWFWNSLPLDARDVTGHLVALGDAGGACANVLAVGGAEVSGVLTLEIAPAIFIRGRTPVAPRAWHHVALVRDGPDVAVYLDGRPEPELRGTGLSPLPGGGELVLGGRHDRRAGLEGKIDDVSWYRRALSREEIRAHHAASGLEAPQPGRLPTTAPGVPRRPHSPEDLERYAETVRASRPLAWWRLHSAESGRVADASGEGNGAELERGAMPRAPASAVANFTGGRLCAHLTGMGASYSVEMWMFNELPVTARPVTGYVFSRGPDLAADAPGDHLGIGGTHAAAGRLIVFNGNERNELLEGPTRLPVGSWNHVVLSRRGSQVRVFLNGELEIDGELTATFARDEPAVFIGGRNDGFAPFRGRIDEVAIYGRPLGGEEAVAHFRAAGVQRDESLPVAGETRPPGPPEPALPARQSLARIHVPPGYRVELVAAEPLVLDPVAIDWGPDGRLWVAEMADYPLGTDGAGRAGGRVRVLEDVDGDGHLDRSTVFLEDLSFPNGVLRWKGGVLVTAAPHILYAEDTNGDGRADLRRVLVDGFVAGNQQLRVNGLRWGLDNWIHCASGGHHGGFGARNSVRIVATGESVPLGSRDLRLRPDENRLDPQSGPSQFGRVRDDWGNWFGVQNSHPLWHYVLDDHYLRRNPHAAIADARRQLRPPANPRVFPAKAPQKRFHSFDQSGRFTSACSPAIYRDRLLFPREGGVVAFTCEPFHNLVQRHIVEADGVSFRARRADDGEVDFFASTDRWCRPVMVRTGPGGALWVVDMYRYMIEHPDFLPPEGQDELRPFFRAGVERGRIYRVVTEDRKPTPPPRLDRLRPEELVRALETPNGTLRDEIQQWIVTGGVRATAPLLERLVATSRDPLARLSALCTLDGLGALQTATILAALSDAHAGVRRQAVRLAETRADRAPDLLSKLVELVNDPGPPVRLQLACSLGELGDPRAGAALGALLRGDRDPFTTAAALSSVNDENIERVMAAVTAGEFTEGSLGACAEVLKLAVAFGRDDVLCRGLAPLAEAPDQAVGAGRLRAVAAVLAEVARRRGGVPERLTVVTAGLADLARETIRNEEADGDLRLAALGVLGRQPESAGQDLEGLAELLSPRTPPALQVAIVDRLAEERDSGIPTLLLARWRQHGPALRSRILSTLATREAWLRDVLAAIEDGRVRAGDLDAAFRQRLASHGSQEIRERSRRVLATGAESDREAVYRSLLPALAIEPDRTRGQELFRDRCATCHRLAGTGHEVGPNLASLTDRRPSTLLRSVIVPSESFDPRFVGYLVLTSDGRSYTGIVTSETGSSVTLLGAQSERRVIPRSRIGLMESTGASLMPLGLEDDLSHQEISDLIHWVAGAAAADNEE